MNDEVGAAVVFGPDQPQRFLMRGSGPRHEMRRNGLPMACLPPWWTGTDDDGDNPLVRERENEPGADWTETGEHLDEFQDASQTTHASEGPTAAS
jgi:hypothetical protein